MLCEVLLLGGATIVKINVMPRDFSICSRVCLITYPSLSSEQLDQNVSASSGKTKSHVVARLALSDLKSEGEWDLPTQLTIILFCIWRASFAQAKLWMSQEHSYSPVPIKGLPWAGHLMWRVPGDCRQVVGKAHLWNSHFFFWCAVPLNLKSKYLIQK